MAAAIGAAVLLAAPWIIRGVVAVDRWLVRALLGPGQLAERVRTLEETRALAVEDSAALLRRLERDLHDGAQARLVALAMGLDMAKERLGHDDEPIADPARVRHLVDSAHRNAIEALAELRDLARGIHPPALDNSDDRKGRHVLPEDGWLRSIRPQPARVTVEDYEALPEEIAGAIEIVDGYVVYSEAPSPDHRTAGRRLANTLEAHARTAMERGHPCVTVNNDVDLRLHDVPLLNRRPDVVLYHCLDRDRGERLRAEHVLLVVEIVSPGSETQDTTDKPAEYAKAGIPHYWIVRLDGAGVSVIERYRLDRAARLYKHVGTFMKEEGGDPPSVANPIPVTIDWAALEF